MKVKVDYTLTYSDLVAVAAYAAAEIAKEKQIDCQISMERRMACGIGVCQSCVIKCRVSGSKKDTIYKLCCEDGPVFDSKEVVF